MKKINKYSFLLSLIVVMVLSSCDERLNVEPQQSIDENSALSTPANVQAALIGAYDGLSDNDVWGGGQHLSELLADDGDQIWAGSFEEPEQIFQKTILVQNVDVERFWTESYETINRANNVLSAIDILDSGDQDQVEGEAKFIRGAVYFDLVNLFAKTWIDGDPNSNSGVPLILNPTRTIDDKSKVGRASVSEVYAQIISDLNDAKSKLPTNNGGLATTYAASAILSRVYLMQERFDDAKNEAEIVISSGEYALVSNFQNAFNQSGNTSEDIFTIEVTSQDGDNDFNLFYAAPEFGGRGDIEVTEAHVAKYEAGDARATMFYVDGTGITRTGKWLDNASLDGNINIVRLAEMYLTRAETRFRTGDTAGAAEDLNIIRNRVGLANIDAGALTLDDILQERQLELMFEGHLFRDRKRNRVQIGDLSFDAAELVYPIPQRELDINPDLGQNVGY